MSREDATHKLVALEVADGGARQIFNEEAGIKVAVAGDEAGASSLEARLGELCFNKEIAKLKVDLCSIEAPGRERNVSVDAEDGAKARLRAKKVE